MTRAVEIMTEDVETIRSSATVAEAVRLLRFKELHALVVERCTDDDAYGIVTDSDIARKVIAQGKDPKEVRVYEIMTKPCIVVNPDLAVEYVARLFAQTGIERAPVIKGELLGMISLSDILHRSDFLDNPRVAILQRALQQKISDARALTATLSADAPEVLEAWETVNLLEAELAFCQGQVPSKTAFQQYGPTKASEAVTA
jgi:CBS domain-containing protein